MRRFLILLTVLFAPAFPADASAQSEPSHAFSTYQGLTYVEPGSAYEVPNMPAVMNQSALGICFSCAAAAVLQKFYCDEDPAAKKLGLPCNQFPPEMQISPLGEVAWMDTNLDMVDGRADNLDPTSIYNHRNLKLYEDRSGYSLGGNGLRNSQYRFKHIAESCYPMQKLLTKYGAEKGSFEPAYHLMKEAWARSKAAQFSTDAVSTLTDVVNEAMILSLTVSEVKDAATKGYVGNPGDERPFPVFLYFSVYGKCKTFIESSHPPRVLGNESALERAEALDLVKSVVASGHPVQVDAVCLMRDRLTKECSYMHSIVLSGYRNVCDKGSSPTVCKSQFKVHNCWGQAWQDEHGGGWFDASNFMLQVNYDESKISRYSLNWLTAD